MTAGTLDFNVRIMYESCTNTPLFLNVLTTLELFPFPQWVIGVARVRIGGVVLVACTMIFLTRGVYCCVSATNLLNFL